MVDNKLEGGAPAESGRSRREPPTIDLEASEVSEVSKTEAMTEMESATSAEAPEPAREAAAASAADSVPVPGSHSVSPWAIAPISGAVAAALVIGVGWVLGWPAVQSPSPAPQLNAAAIDDLTARIAGIESKIGQPAADPAAAARMEQIEKSVATLRSELTATRAQAEKLASAVSELKAQPRGDGSTAAAAVVDLSPVNDRLAEVERVAKAQEAAIAAVKSAEAKFADGKPAADAALRRVVAASLLDLSVRHGDPFSAQLATARSLAPSPDALKPLDAFAASGIPSVAELCRELSVIAPKLAPPAPDAEAAGGGIVDRLKSGATKLVRIERADATGTDRASVVARITAAAVRNQLDDARRELATLAPADRAAAQGWVDKADAREAALAASRKFASDAMTALATAK